MKNSKHVNEKSFFKGLRVLELANVLAGPSVGAFFAELGANVIKIENVFGKGDVTRHWKIPSEDKETSVSSYFSCVNWGKKSVVVDLKQDEGKDLIYKLTAVSDIVLSSYKPGDAEKLNVDYSSLKKHNEKLIYAHITGYGKNLKRTGYDAIVQAESGFMYINGQPESSPTKMPVALMDILCAHNIKEAVLIALLNREKYGHGDEIYASLFHAGVSSLANQATNWLVAGVVPQRIGSEHPNIVPYGTAYETGDGKSFVLAVGSEGQFKNLCTIINMPELFEDSRFCNNVQRVKNREELNIILDKQFKKMSLKDLLNDFNNYQIPAGAINNMKDVFSLPEARDLLQEKVDSNGKKWVGVKHCAFESSAARSQNLTPPPEYGEHTAQVLKNLLEIDDKTMSFLAQKGVIYGK